MPRQDVPYGGAICRLKERIAEIWDELGKKLHSINGVEGDAAGDVKIVSGDAAVVITSDQVNHQIEVALDSSQLPAASVSSVNGQTGAVVLDANDIDAGLTPPGTSVAQDLAGTKQQMQVVGGLVQQEILNRQNADSTLQTNINAVAADVAPFTGTTGNDLKPIKIVNGSPVAVTNDLVDTASAQTVGGDKTFSGQMLATGQRAYAPGNTTDVATIGTLDAYAPMVRTTGNQDIGGIKSFYNPITQVSPTIDITTTPDPGNYFIGANINFVDKNNVNWVSLRPIKGSDGKSTLQAIIRRGDGTYDYLNIISSTA